MVVSPHNHPHFLTPFKKNNRFYNHKNEKSRTVFLHSLWMFSKSWVKRRFLTQKNVEFPQHIQNASASVPGNIEITWIGHSTFYIKIDGITIITDPIFGDASLLFARITPPGIPLHDLNAVDYVVLSHNHRDHMDAKSLLHIRRFQPNVLVPSGDKKWFCKRSFDSVYEAEWWQNIEFFSPQGVPINFYFLPAYHWSQRSLFDKNRSLWGSWMIEYQGYRIYFGGDTANWNHFEAIARVFPSIDIALLPIGPCEPRTWMQHSHINAQEAGEAFLTLRARHFIPMHYGTFHFGLDAVHTPLEQLFSWWQHQQDHLAHAQLHVPGVGKTLHFNTIPETTTAKAVLQHQKPF